MQTVSVIIVTHNNRNDIERCLRSLSLGNDTSLIIVDNNSTDGTVEFVRSSYPALTIILNKENRGFAAANNQALRVVQTNFVVLLNPDTVLRNDAFAIMKEYLLAHPDVWIVGPRMFNPDGSDQRTGVRFPSIWNTISETFFLDRLFPRSRIFGQHKELYTDPSTPRQVDYLQGSCIMVRTDAVHRVGLLDEQFFMYFEETDWCHRMRESGGSVHYVPTAEVVHYGGGEFGHYDEKRLVFFHRSLLLFYQKHRGRLRLIVLRAVLLVRIVVRICAWSVYRFVKPAAAADASSAMRGYVRSLGVVTGKVVS